jgi:hypothetical protein
MKITDEDVTTNMVETKTGVTTAKLWIGSAYNDDRDGKYGLIAVIAETQEEAIAKARHYVQQSSVNPYDSEHVSQYAVDLLDNLDNMREVTREVFVDWNASTRWY